MSNPRYGERLKIGKEFKEQEDKQRLVQESVTENEIAVGLRSEWDRYSRDKGWLKVKEKIYFI